MKFQIIEEHEETLVIRRIRIEKDGKPYHVVLVRNKDDELRGVPDSGCSVHKGAVWCACLDTVFSWLKAIGVVRDR